MVIINPICSSHLTELNGLCMKYYNTGKMQQNVRALGSNCRWLLCGLLRSSEQTEQMSLEHALFVHFCQSINSSIVIHTNGLKLLSCCSTIADLKMLYEQYRF
jgi:hypothetical protein